ncbi:MAG: DUF1573 domain-containing protein [Bacteroidales bacterium]
MILNLLKLTSLIICVVLSSCKETGLVSIHTSDIELGLHTDNNSISFNISLLNKSSSPIQIDSITTSVSYLSPTTRVNEPIQPGDTLEIPMSLFTHSIKGDVVAKVRIFNSSSNIPIEQIVKASIQATPADISELCTVPFGPLLIDRNIISMNTILVGKENYDSILVYNPTDRAVTVTLPRSYGNVSASMRTNIINSRKADYIIVTARYDDETKIGDKVFHNFRFNFDRNVSTDAYIYLQGELAEDFSSLTAIERKEAPIAHVQPRSFDFGSIKEGHEVNHSFILHNKGKRVLLIRSASSSCDCTLLKLQKDSILPGESIPLTLYFNSKGKYGAQQRQVKIKTNDPQNSIIDLWLNGEVK